MKTTTSLDSMFRIPPEGVVITVAATEPVENGDSPAEPDYIALANHVRQSLAADPSLRRVRLSVEAFTGVVQLDGVVASDVERDRCVDVAARVSGVHAVRDCIRVAEPEGSHGNAN